MKALYFLIFILNGFTLNACETFQDNIFPEKLFPEIIINTKQGNIIVELDRRKAPLTVNRFLNYINTNTYDQSIIHRIVKDYVVQAGAFSKNMQPIKSCGQLFNESGNGLSNSKYTIAMARHNNPHSAETSFYFNMKDNTNLDPSSKSWGYTVFGYVTEGEEILDKIAQTHTEFSKEINAKDFPTETILIQSITIK